MQKARQQGFTLIELSIVLVIIGLLVGGVLVGQDLIRAAQVRATISQIEKFNTAVNTFYGKYGSLPGDINASAAAQFGFAARGQYAGEGDGNGVIEGNWGNCSGCNSGESEAAGETVLFWADLSQASLIEGSFTQASYSNPSGVISNAQVPAYFPAGKLGNGNYFYVWESESASGGNSTNYFGLSSVNSVAGNKISPATNPGVSVQQAYSIDKKIDDGLPQSGRVQALYLTQTAWPAWAGNSTNNYGAPFSTATTGSSSTCFDNGGGSGPQQYSITQNGGAGVNCALSFQFQ